MSTPTDAMTLQWDIFCKVIDNFGDIGVCWRLAADLATRGQQVRLWVDNASALAWMAPRGASGVQVLLWTEALNVSCLATAPCDVLVEAFGCDVAPEFVAACARYTRASALKNPLKPLWINLEYLSAEPYVERNHGLTNLVSTGPAAGWHKVFYYPGFTTGSGGLLREPGLLRRQAAFDRAGWLAQFGVDWQGENNEVLVSLFCYEPASLADLMADWTQNGINGKRVRLLAADGRATQAVKAVIASKTGQNTLPISLKPNKIGGEQLSISYLPKLLQTDYDHLLWACDLNFVRGEDSLVRAIWAGKPFVWQLYPQADDAHAPKLEAFLSRLAAPPSLQTFHRVWNGLADQPLPQATELHAWAQTAARYRAGLLTQPDLTDGLIKYALKTR